MFVCGAEAGFHFAPRLHFDADFSNTTQVVLIWCPAASDALRNPLDRRYGCSAGRLRPPTPVSGGAVTAPRWGRARQPVNRDDLRVKQRAVAAPHASVAAAMRTPGCVEVWGWLEETPARRVFWLQIQTLEMFIPASG